MHLGGFLDRFVTLRRPDCYCGGCHYGYGFITGIALSMAEDGSAADDTAEVL